MTDIPGITEAQIDTIEQLDDSLYSRPYKSRRQRPCDFCRKRKSCCIIEGTVPCKLCRYFKRECTFLEGPVARPKPKFDENGQKIVMRRRSPSSTKKEPKKDTKPKVRKPKKGKSMDIKLEGDVIRENQDTTRIPTLQSNQEAEILAIKEELSSFELLPKDTLDQIAEPTETLVGVNDLQLRSLHYSLEDHEFTFNSGGLMAEAQERYMEENFAEQALYDDEDLAGLTDSMSATDRSRPNSIAITSESVSSLDSPGTPLFGMNDMHPMIMYNQVPTSGQIDEEFLIPLVLKPDTLERYETKAVVSQKYALHQRQIFEILDSYGDKLVNLYLTYVNPFIPILSKSQINFIYNNGEFNKQSVISRLKRLDLAIISSVVACALEYWDTDNDLILEARPSIEIVSEMTYDMIFGEHEATKFSSSTQKKFDLLQACLISCVKGSFDITDLEKLAKIDTMKSLISIAHSLITDLGLSFCNSTADEEEIFKTNLWWCFYLEEKWFSLLIGRKSIIPEFQGQIEVEIQTPDDFVPSTVTSIMQSVSMQDSGVDYTSFDTLHKSCSLYFKEMIKLTLVVSEISNRMEVQKSTVRDSPFATVTELYHEAERLESRLYQWKNQLPGYFRTGSTFTNQSRLGAYMNANASLHISYCVARMSIYKRLLKVFTALAMAKAGNNNTLISDLSKFDTQFNDIKLKATNVSVECFQSIKSMKLQDLDGFWYAFTNFKFIFIANFYIMLHVVLTKTSHDSQGGDSQYNNTLQLKSTIQKVLTDFKNVMRNRSCRWKIVRLTNDVFCNFKEARDLNVLEDYSNCSSRWNKQTPQITQQQPQQQQQQQTSQQVAPFFLRSSVSFANHSEPMSLDEDYIAPPAAVKPFAV